MKKTYQALYTIELSVSVEVEADDPVEAQEAFENYVMNGAEDIIKRGYVHNENIEWDSSLRPIKKRKPK